MRILFTIPHHYRPKSNSASGEALHGSQAQHNELRVRALTSCIITLHQTFGTRQSHISKPNVGCNDRVAAEIDIVICTTGGHHLIERLPNALFVHHATAAEPLLLGYECHAVQAKNLGKYDY